MQPSRNVQTGIKRKRKYGKQVWIQIAIWDGMLDIKGIKKIVTDSVCPDSGNVNKDGKRKRIF